MTKPKNLVKEVDLPEDLLMDLLTPSELRMIKNRWQIINLIHEGMPVRKIAALAKVGTDTVVRMSKKLQRNPKLRRHFNGEPARNSSQWVFGRPESEL